MTPTVNPCRIIDSRERDSRKNRVAGGETSVRLKETKDAELVRSSVPIAGENDGYVDAQPEIEDCSNGFAPQPNTTADGSQKMIVPVVLSMTSYPLLRTLSVLPPAGNAPQ